MTEALSSPSARAPLDWRRRGPSADLAPNRRLSGITHSRRLAERASIEGGPHAGWPRPANHTDVRIDDMLRSLHRHPLSERTVGIMRAAGMTEHTDFTMRKRYTQVKEARLALALARPRAITLTTQKIGCAIL